MKHEPRQCMPSVENDLVALATLSLSIIERSEIGH